MKAWSRRALFCSLAYTALSIFITSGKAMVKYFSVYATTLLAMVILDLIWLGVIAKPLYQQGIGHLMADKPNVVVAVIFYAVFAMGLTVFAVVQPGAGWPKTWLLAALFGFCAYATYDLTNLATLKQWPIALSLIDMAWGTLVSVVSASAGKAVWIRLDMS